jgi:hypothetical protein
MTIVAKWESVMQAEDLPEGTQRRDTDALASESARLSVRREEAARILGIGIDSLDTHVLPEIRTVRLNRMVLVPLEELRRWLARRASCVGADW